MFIQSALAPLPALIDALSHPRLSSYRKFFGATNDAAALGIYQWNEELSATLFRAISLVEIVLRNQFHRSLSTRYGTSGSLVSRDWYEHIALKPLSLKKIQAITQTKHHGVWLPKKPVPSPDDVVSKLTFGFWPHLLEATVDSTGSPIAWDTILLDILPGHRQRQAAYWKRQAHRDAFFARMDLCNELRNRIAHHEPIWKLGPLMEEARPRPQRPVNIVAPPPATPKDALARLSLIYGRLLELLNWLSPPISQAFRGSQIDVSSQMLISERALRHFEARRQLAEADIKALGSKKTMRKLLRYAVRHRQPLHLTDGPTSVGHWVCPIK